MSNKPKLSITSIINMSVGFFGIQFGFALQNGNVSRIFQTLGAEIEEIPILWVAAPMTGLIVQPIIGYFSDRTWHKKWGRRRPFFFIGALLASIALFLMPNSATLWIAAGMLWILDASINISMEPFRAFVGDNLPDEQRTMGFAMQSFFIGAGAYIASWLPTIFNAMGVSNTATAGVVPDTVKFSFYLGGLVFFLSVLYTVLTSKEYSPEEMLAFESEDKQKVNINTSTSVSDRYLLSLGVFGLILGSIVSYLIYVYQLKKDLYILSIGIITLFGLLYFIGGLMKRIGMRENGFTNILQDFLTMPKTMKQLAVVQFFSWFALFAFWIYSTAAITEHIYGTTDPTSDIYNDGANTVSGMMGELQSYSCNCCIFDPNYSS
ncbi:MAG: MFS transporter [Saprospiraceae bacterium]